MFSQVCVILFTGKCVMSLPVPGPMVRPGGSGGGCVWSVTWSVWGRGSVIRYMVHPPSRGGGGVVRYMVRPWGGYGQTPLEADTPPPRQTIQTRSDILYPSVMTEI